MTYALLCTQRRDERSAAHEVQAEVQGAPNSHQNGQGFPTLIRTKTVGITRLSDGAASGI